MIFADDVNKYPANNLWSAICFKIMTRYTRGFFPRIVAIIPATRYTCVFLSRILAFFPALWVQTRIYMRTKTPIYMRYKQACGIWGHRKLSYKTHRIIPSTKKPLHVRWSWKVTSVWIKHGRNGRVNFEQGLVLIHCPHSSGVCWLPDNELVGIRGLSLERLCTLFHECWPKQRSIQLEISVRQAKHDS